MFTLIKYSMLINGISHENVNLYASFEASVIEMKLKRDARVSGIQLIAVFDSINDARRVQNTMRLNNNLT
jgi:pyruvate/oxaloacetate carboxyltransferase